VHNYKKIKIFNVTFYDAKYKKLKNLLDKKGGLLVLPSGPGLSSIDKDKKYHTALINSDIALFDSGYLCLLLRIIKGLKVNKYSGYKFFNDLIINLKKEKSKKIFIVDPSQKESLINKNFFISKNIKNTFHYIAPIYKKKIIDKRLLKEVKKIKPKYIIINLGGGTQEILGYYIKKNIKKKITIFCTLASISFYTKQQAPMNDIIDKMYLGWLIRIIYNPFIFLPRYFSAIRLFFLIKNLSNREMKF